MIVGTILMRRRQLVLRSCQCAPLKMTVIGATRVVTSIGQCKLMKLNSVFIPYPGFRDQLQLKTLVLTLTTAPDYLPGTIFILRRTRAHRRWVSSAVLTSSHHPAAVLLGSTITSMATMLALSQYSHVVLSMERSLGKR